MITALQAQEMVERLDRNRKRCTIEPSEWDAKQAQKPAERKLHEQIMTFCDQQFPRWKYRHSRMDKATTSQVGSEDFVISASGGRTFYVECKKRGSKLSKEQLIWHKEMSLLQITVHVIYSIEQFIELCEQTSKEKGSENL